MNESLRRPTSIEVASWVRAIVPMLMLVGGVRTLTESETAVVVAGLTACVWAALSIWWSYLDRAKLRRKVVGEVGEAGEGRWGREVTDQDLSDMLDRVADVGVCAACGEENTLGVGDDLCRPCIAKARKPGEGGRFPLGIPTDGNGMETVTEPETK